MKYVHVALFLPFCPMSENASLGTAFLPAIAKFRENVTLARRILPAGERSVRVDASDRWDLRFFTRKQAGLLMGPAMESGNGGLVPRCPWTVGSLSWGAELSWRSPRARFRKPSRFASPARATRDTEWQLRLLARRRFRHVSARYGSGRSSAMFQAC